MAMFITTSVDRDQEKLILLAWNFSYNLSQINKNLGALRLSWPHNAMPGCFMVEFNRLLWMLLFLIGTVFFAWLEWQGKQSAPMMFFLMTSLWSAVCGIGYTVMHWFFARRINDQEG